MIIQYIQYNKTNKKKQTIVNDNLVEARAANNITFLVRKRERTKSNQARESQRPMERVPNTHGDYRKANKNKEKKTETIKIKPNFQTNLLCFLSPNN